MGRTIKSKKATQTACLRSFSRYLAGAEGFEPSARGFGVTEHANQKPCKTGSLQSINITTHISTHIKLLHAFL